MPKKYKLADVKAQIEKVAFDVVRFKDDDNRANLWQIQSCDDGDYIIALYDEDFKKESEWEASLDKTASFVHIFYKKTELGKLSSKDLGDLDLVRAAKILPQKLASNNQLKDLFLDRLPSKQVVLAKFPELKTGTR